MLFRSIIKKSGSWFSYNEAKIGQGADKAKLFLKENPDMLDAVEAKLRDKISPEEFTSTPEDHAADDSEDI